MNKLLDIELLTRRGDCYYTTIEPSNVKLLFYGKLQVTIANFIHGLYSICITNLEDICDEMSEDEFVIKYKNKVICKFLFSNNNPCIMYGNVSKEITYKNKDYELLKREFKKYINILKNI